MKRTKDFKSGVKCVYSVIIMFAIAVGIMAGFSNCTQETLLQRAINPTDTIPIFKELYYESARTVAASVSVKDSLAKSEAQFNQTSTFYNERENIQLKFHPTAYITIRLSQERIDVGSTDELPIILSRSALQSQTPYKNGNTVGVDAVKVFEFSDGQVATVSYGYRYTAVTLDDGKVLDAPHMEITDIKYVEHSIYPDGTPTEVEDPYKLVLAFEADYVSKGTSSEEVSYSEMMHPWYMKIVTSEPTTVLSTTYEGRFLDCPYNGYELTETVKTNKGEIVNKYNVGVTISVTTPTLREQPTLDSLFVAKSTGKADQQTLSEVKNEDGFTMRTVSGSYVSSNTGRENKTVVTSTISYTCQFPVKFESKYGAYEIPAVSLNFTEEGFKVTRVSETADEILFKSVNTVTGKIGDCTLDLGDEVVNLRFAKAKKPDVVAKDSTYVLGGSDDDYTVDKEVTWSDGSKTKSSYTYKGKHWAKAIAFGEVVTSSLNWNAGTLQPAGQTTSTEEEKFSPTTKFVAVYTTTTRRSDATNGRESGKFQFEDCSPKVTFVDGNVQKTFPERKYVLVGIGATLGQNPTTTVRNGVTYNAYPYDFTTKASYNSNDPEDLISQGWLLVLADVIGDAEYTTNQTWNGKTTTVTVTKTTPHSQGQDEVENWQSSYTVSMDGLTDGKVYADNTSFSASRTHSESKNTTTKTPWSTTAYTSTYAYTITNGKVSRTDLKLIVQDATITFNDGTFSHTFDARLNISESESFGTQRQDGNYNVTPHVLTVTGTTSGGQQFSSKATTDIYVKRDAEVTGHTEKSVVYPDGTVDAEITITKDDGTSETVKASDTFGQRFSFNFTNVSPQTKVVSNVNHTASGSVGNASQTPHKKGNWSVTEYRYPYNHLLSNGVTADNVSSAYAYSNYAFVYTDNAVGTVTVPVPTVTMAHKSLNITNTGTSGGYVNHNAAVVVSGSAQGTEGSYSTDLSVTHKLNIKEEPQEPEQPHLGKPKAFTVTAAYDPGASVTKRAFVFNWDGGVTYAICDYEKELPASSDFSYKVDSYTGYNSVGWNSNTSVHWEPARGVDSSDAIRWYDSSGSLISLIDKALSCKFIGWKNIVDGQYALVIPGYTYTIDGYYITVKAPSGQTVTFNSHY